MVIEESQMKFLVDDDNLFHIEKDDMVTSMTGVKTVEYIECRKDTCFTFIEAKSSCPQPMNKQNFDSYMKDISEKMINSMSILHAILLERHGKEKFQAMLVNFRKTSLKRADINFRFFLVIHGAQKAWLPDLQNGLQKQLKAFLQCWNIKGSNVKVINDVQAHDMGMIE